MAYATTSKLFTGLKLGGKKNSIQLNHRIVMAPLMRLRAGEDGVPGPVVSEHYAQRASDGGLLIAEATNISAAARGYFGTPGLFEQAQVDGWKQVTKAVHDKGGKIFVQLWHTGRVSHPHNLPNGDLPVSSSTTSMDNVKNFDITREGQKPFVIPRALEVAEIENIVADFKRAAYNAIEAGFDGVEINACSGYLLEQFLCDSVNKRTDNYGGSIENRARFTFEVLEAILSSIESSQVGIRLSPFGDTVGCKDSNPNETYGYVVNKLNDYDLAYLHLIERRGVHVDNVQVPEVGVTRHFRDAYKGILLTSSGYDRADAIKTLNEGAADFVAFGRGFIANPDFVEGLRSGAELNAPNMKTLFPAPGASYQIGYTDYPFLTQKK